MIWHIKKEYETQNEILISYSYGENKACDGLIKYDKTKDDFSVEKLSDGESESSTELVYEFAYGLMQKNKLTEKRYVVQTG